MPGSRMPSWPTARPRSGLRSAPCPASPARPRPSAPSRATVSATCCANSAAFAESLHRRPAGRRSLPHLPLEFIPQRPQISLKDSASVVLHFLNSQQELRVTTIVSVRRHGKVVIGGDGQVSLGNTVMKGNDRKVRRLYHD